MRREYHANIIRRTSADLIQVCERGRLAVVIPATVDDQPFPARDMDGKALAKTGSKN